MLLELFHVKVNVAILDEVEVRINLVSYMLWKI